MSVRSEWRRVADGIFYDGEVRQYWVRVTLRFGQTADKLLKAGSETEAFAMYWNGAVMRERDKVVDLRKLLPSLPEKDPSTVEQLAAKRKEKLQRRYEVSDSTKHGIKSGGIRENTLMRYVDDIDALVLRYLRNDSDGNPTNVIDLDNPDRLQSWVLAMAEDGVTQKRQAMATWHLQKILELGNARERAIAGVVKQLQTIEPIKCRPRRRTVRVEPEEQRDIARGMDPALRAGVHLGYHVLMRTGEVLGLGRHDVWLRDLDGRQGPSEEEWFDLLLKQHGPEHVTALQPGRAAGWIAIWRQRTPVFTWRNGRTVQVEKVLPWPKTDRGWRIEPIGPSLASWLAGYCRRFHSTFSWDEPYGERLLVVSMSFGPDGIPQAPTYLNYEERVKKVSRALSVAQRLGHATHHLLRESTGVELLGRGLSIPVVGDALGHADARGILLPKLLWGQTTTYSKYLRTALSDQFEVMDAVEDLITTTGPLEDDSDTPVRLGDGTEFVDRRDIARILHMRESSADRLMWSGELAFQKMWVWGRGGRKLYVAKRADVEALRARGVIGRGPRKKVA